MNEDEARLVMAAMAALEADEGGTASKGLIESAEPMEATCEVKTSE